MIVLLDFEYVDAQRLMNMHTGCGLFSERLSGELRIFSDVSMGTNRGPARRVGSPSEARANRSQVLRELFPEDWNAEGAKLPHGYVAENTSPGDSEPKKKGHNLYPFASPSLKVRFRGMNHNDEERARWEKSH